MTELDQLLDAFAGKSIDARTFRDRFLEARRSSIARGEDGKTPGGRLMDEVFYAVDAFCPEPDLREPANGDTDEARFTADVLALHRRIDPPRLVFRSGETQNI